MKFILLFLAPFSAFVFIACGGDKKESAAAPATAQEALSQAQQTINQTQQAMKDASMQQPVEPVNFRQLQEFLPEKLAGFERDKLSGESAGAMGIKFSKAEGKYKNGEGQNLRLDLVDTGGLGMTTMSMAAWSSVTIDKEDDKGYERTGTLGGFKSFEKFRKNGSDSELSLLVENRFVVKASCRGCSMEAMRSAVQTMDLNKLKNL